MTGSEHSPSTSCCCSTRGCRLVEGGYVGVDLFFVLSGFLVSGVILNEIDSTGRLRLGNFYARRVRRLLPAALVVVVATGATFVLLTSVVRRLSFIGDAQSALLYYANWHFLIRSEDYFATDVAKSPFLHFWSLAIEEQFYVVFPLLLVGLVWASRRRSWLLGGGIGLLLVLSLGSQFYWMNADPGHAYYGTDARLYQLLAGALLAVAVRAGWAIRRPVAGGAAGLALMLVVASGWLSLNTSWRGLLATVASVLLISGLLAGRGPVVRFFELRVPVYLGKISYGTYLWHWPVLLVLLELISRPSAGARSAGRSAEHGAGGALRRAARAADPSVDRSPSIQWPVAIAGVLTSAIVAVAVMTPMLESPRKPALASQGVGFTATGTGREPIPDDIDWEEVADDTGRGRPCLDPTECTLVDKGGPTVLLVGDSHAKMLAPMVKKLANKRGFTFAANILRGCPWQADLVNTTRPPSAQETCRQLRGEWYEKAIPVIKPDLVILVSQSYDLDPRYENGGLSRIGGSDETIEELIANTTRETLDCSASWARAPSWCATPSGSTATRSTAWREPGSSSSAWCRSRSA